MQRAVVLFFLCCVVAICVGDNFFHLDNFTRAQEPSTSPEVGTWGSIGGTECTSQRVCKNRHCQQNDKRDVYLDCIPDWYRRVYAYYGDRKTAVGKRQEPFCAKWYQARASIEQYIIRKELQLDQFGFLPDEYVLHNECRNVQLNLIAGSPTVLTAKHFHLYHAEWQEGPWCYVWNTLTEMYEPQRCFEPCPDNWTPMITTTTTAEPTTANSTSDPIKYNQELIDHLHFAAYVWGDLRYYDSKPSDDPLSDSFYRNRETMFYMLCGVLGLLMTFFMVNGAIRVFRERKRRNGLIDDHAVQIVSTQENDVSKTAQDA